MAILAERQPDQSFTYAFELEPLDAGPNGWMAFITGAFHPSPGIRRGVGNFTMDTTALRAGNFAFDTDTARTQSIAVKLSTKEFPKSVTVDSSITPTTPTWAPPIRFTTSTACRPMGKGR